MRHHSSDGKSGAGRLIRRIFSSGALFLGLLYAVPAFADEDGSIFPVIGGIVSLVFAVSIFIAYLVYQKRQQDKRDESLLLSGSSGSEGNTDSEIEEIVERLPLRESDREEVAEAFSKAVKSQTGQIREDVRREFAKKYDKIIDEKSKEVETVKKEFQVVEKKYHAAETAYKKVDAEKKTTEAVVKSISEGLVVVNQKGEVLIMNPSAEKILGIQKEKKVGKSIMEGLSDEHLISMSRDDGDSNEKIVEYKSKNEDVKKIIRSSSAVIQNEDGQTIGMVNVLTDVTKQRELDEMKNQFVSNVTHELRTPIVAMQKSLEILSSSSAGPLNEAQTNFLHIVSRNLTHLSTLVEDVLDVSRIDSGNVKIRMGTHDLLQTIQDACNALDMWAKSKEIEIVQKTEKIPQVQLDRDKITQVLNNLLSNAIKFTPKGGKITVTCEKADSGTVSVEVRDTGIGIAKENIPKLFRRFAQFGNQQGISGTGLGLCIAKDIVERHGGKMSVESRPEQGAAFSFTLPIQQPS